MDEIMMRMFARLYGLDVLSFGVDYKVNGQDKHGAFQAMCPGNDEQRAARGLAKQLKAQGWIPQMIAYYPGDYTMAELDKVMDERPIVHEYKTLFVSDCALREMQAACGR